MSTFKPDAGIPLLTEVIDAPLLDEAPAPIAAPPSPGPALRPAIDAEQWVRLERELREQVLEQVMKRIDLALEQRVRDSLADVLQTAVENLATEIRTGLHQTVKSVVSHAVTQEIAAARVSKK